MISPESKPQISERRLELSVIDGKKPLTSIGTVDPGLFKGENCLRAVMDPETCLWSFKYDKGRVPPALTGEFTGYKALRKHADNYFFHRNIAVTEVRD